MKGEKVSAFLIKKQANVKSQKLLNAIKTEENIMENLEPNTMLKDKNSILLYIKNYYQKLYMKEDYDEEYQNKFLELITKVLTEEEQKLLMEEVSQNEIFKAINDMNINRAPGIDGIPVEFYIQYWSTIKSEITDIIKNIIKGTLLKKSKERRL